MWERETDQETEREGTDNRESDSYPGELDFADITDENVGDGIGAVLAKNVERDGSSYLPQFHCLSPEHPPHLRHTPRRRVVPVIDQWRRLHLGRDGHVSSSP